MKIILPIILLLVAEVSFSKNFSFDSVIVDAAEQNKLSVVQTLLSEGVSANEKGKFETTALHRASFNGKDDIVKVLINAGANPDNKDFGGATALHMAARKGNIAVVRELIKAGADLNSMDNEGFTPLQRAISNDNTGIGIFMLEAGAMVDSVDSSGSTPLIEAVRKSNAPLVEELILQGAEPQARNNSGLSALDYATRVNNSEIESLLSKSSAEIRRSRALEGNSVIVVTESQISRKALPSFISDNLPTRSNAPIDIPEVNLEDFAYNESSLGYVAPPATYSSSNNNSLPWLSQDNDGYVSSTKPVSLSGSYTGDFEYRAPTNMPIVNTPSVISDDSEITEEQVIDTLSEEERYSTNFDVPKIQLPPSNYKSEPESIYSGSSYKPIMNGYSRKDQGFFTKPVDGISVVREQSYGDKIPLSRDYTSVENPVERDYKSSVDYDSPRVKLARNEVDYSDYDLDSLPASLKVKYLMSLSPQERNRRISNRVNLSSANSSNVNGAHINVRPLSITSNTEEFLSAPPVKQNQYSYNNRPKVIVPTIIEEEPINNINSNPFGNDLLVDRKASKIINSKDPNFVKNPLPWDSKRDLPYSKNNLVTDINSFYNEGSSPARKYDLDSLQVERNKQLKIGGTYKSRASYKQELKTLDTFPEKNINNNINSRLPKSQLYKKAIAARSNIELSSDLAYSDNPQPITSNSKYIELEKSKKSIEPKINASVESDMPKIQAIAVFDEEPASLDNSKTQTDSLLSWDGFSNEDVDELYNQVVLGNEHVTENSDNLVSVNQFPTSGIINNPDVRAIPVQVSEIETLKPNAQVQEINEVLPEDVDEVSDKGTINIPDFGLESSGLPPLPKEFEINAPSFEASTKSIPSMADVDYNSLSGNHSIIGSFASSDDAISYFNSISSRLGFAYNHKILQSKNDGKYYIAIMSSDSNESDKLCKAYSSDYVECKKTNSETSTSGYEILKSKKIHAILGEFDSAESARVYFSKNIANKNINYKVAKAGSSNVYLLQLGPISDGATAKKLCSEVSGVNQKCKITVK